MKLRNFYSISNSGNKQCRRGASVVEAAIVLPVLLMVLMVALDLALMVLEYNTLAEGSRKLARAASLRGEYSEPEITSWGPETYSSSIAEDSVQTQIVKPICVTMPHQEVTVQLEWLDGVNEADSRVKATVSYVHQPVFGLLGADLPMQSSSVVRIRH
ncbi:TadE/TadG family type IV pilus assembly protein [Thalassoglobus sp.]|uniref:TadE/TadG family type IV pilus assembly protein n=1 Tax=Thalassoglobus sp. TaxID=2795869 RepID=UPI003AA85889